MIAALACGLFYGAFLSAVWRKEKAHRRLREAMDRLVDDVWCEWPWRRKDGEEWDKDWLYKVTHTGHEGHIEA